MEENDVQELFDQYHAGELEIWDLMEQLEVERFDGDIFEYL